jgi:hypothetical protein
LCAFLLSGCLTTPETRTNGLRFDVESGAYVHESSGFHFPQSVGSFERTSDINQYDEAGRDVSVGYGIREAARQAAVTVYVYPALRDYSLTPIPKFGSTPEWFMTKRYEEAKRAIIETYRARLLTESDIRPPQAGFRDMGRKAVFQYDAVNGETVTTLLYLFAHKGWLIKYRITYPSVQAVLIVPDVEKFVNVIVWP